MKVAGTGFVSTLESRAQAYTVAWVGWILFLIVAWPFILVSRLILYVGSCGKINMTYRQSLEHQGVVVLAYMIFVPLLFYVHIVYGARIYGNHSD